MSARTILFLVLIDSAATWYYVVLASGPLMPFSTCFVWHVVDPTKVVLCTCVFSCHQWKWHLPTFFQKRHPQQRWTDLSKYVCTNQTPPQQLRWKDSLPTTRRPGGTHGPTKKRIQVHAHTHTNIISKTPDASPAWSHPSFGSQGAPRSTSPSVLLFAKCIDFLIPCQVKVHMD